jgi:intracellular sulfur oxidation DsrE/DsrF family protein
MRSSFILIASAFLLAGSPALAGPQNFTMGPVLTDSGPVAKVASDVPLAANMDWKMAFSVPASQPGKLNNKIDAAARFINMLAASGVPMSRIHVAVIVHSGGLRDILIPAKYAAESDGAENANDKVIRGLIAKGVPVYVCGQSAELSDLHKADLIPGVKMAISAMTVSAELQHQGYAVNQ